MKLMKREARDLCRENWETKRVRPVVFGTWCAFLGTGGCCCHYGHNRQRFVFSCVFLFFCICSRMIALYPWTGVLTSERVCMWKKEKREWESYLQHHKTKLLTVITLIFIVNATAHLSSTHNQQNILQPFLTFLRSTDLLKGCTREGPTSLVSRKLQIWQSRWIC